MFDNEGLYRLRSSCCTPHNITRCAPNETTTHTQNTNPTTRPHATLSLKLEEQLCCLQPAVSVAYLNPMLESIKTSTPKGPRPKTNVADTNSSPNSENRRAVQIGADSGVWQLSSAPWAGPLRAMQTNDTRRAYKEMHIYIRSTVYKQTVYKYMLFLFFTE